MFDEAKSATEAAIRDAGGDEPVDYLTEELILGYMGEPTQVTEKDLEEHGGRRATADDVPPDVHPEDFWVMYGWNVVRIGTYVYFQIVSTSNACTSYKRRMYNASMRIVSTANCGRTKYQITGWYAPQPV